MNRRTTAMIIVFILVVIGGALTIAFRGGNTTANVCKSSGTVVNYQVVIQNGKVSNTNLMAKKCDTITFTNEDPITREIAFGPHEHHVAYDGITEQALNRSDTLTITLVQAGSFHWHDHLHDEVQGDFTVTPS